MKALGWVTLGIVLGLVISYLVSGRTNPDPSPLITQDSINTLKDEIAASKARERLALDSLGQLTKERDSLNKDIKRLKNKAHGIRTKILPPITNIDSFFIQRYGPGSIYRLGSSKDSGGASIQRPTGRASTSSRFVTAKNGGQDNKLGSRERHSNAHPPGKEQAIRRIRDNQHQPRIKDKPVLPKHNKTKKKKPVYNYWEWRNSRIVNSKINIT